MLCHEPTTRPSPSVDHTPTGGNLGNYRVDSGSDLWETLLDGAGNCGIFMVDDSWREKGFNQLMSQSSVAGRLGKS